jgi:hypothetical protein
MATETINTPALTINVIRQTEDEEEPTFWVRHRVIGQIIVSVVVVGIAVVGVVTSPNPWSIKDLCIAVVSAVVGLWLPAPKIK